MLLYVPMPAAWGRGGDMLPQLRTLVDGDATPVIWCMPVTIMTLVNINGCSKCPDVYTPDCGSH